MPPVFYSEYLNLCDAGGAVTAGVDAHSFPCGERLVRGLSNSKRWLPWIDSAVTLCAALLLDCRGMRDARENVMRDRVTAFFAKATTLKMPVLALCVALLASCATNGVGDTSVRSAQCTAKVLVTLRAGSPSGRVDPDFGALSRAAGATLSTTDSFGSNTRMITINAKGTDEACERAIQRLRDHPRVEAVQQVS